MPLSALAAGTRVIRRKRAKKNSKSMWGLLAVQLKAVSTDFFTFLIKSYRPERFHVNASVVRSLLRIEQSARDSK